MSEQQATNSVQERPAPEGYVTWQVYWMAQGMPWRTEPEIEEQRRRELTERRVIRPDSEKGLYPFKDVKLDRGDVEWLLATHRSKGIVGPVDWNNDDQKDREGLDLRGSDLRDSDLNALPLARLLGATPLKQVNDLTRAQRRMAVAHLEGANLENAHLEGVDLNRAYLNDADLRGAHMEQAILYATHLESANLNFVHLDGADLRRAYFDTASYLYGTVLSSKANGSIKVDNTRWNGANLTTAQLADLKILGDEQYALERRHRGSRRHRTERFTRAVRANRQFALFLRSQGLSEDADRFSYRAQVSQRKVLRRQRRIGSWLFSLLLWALSGYGYRLRRVVATYLIVLFAFAAGYYFLGDWFSEPHLQPYEALLMSFTNIHGRAFTGVFDFSVVPVRAWLAGVQALFGLVIEGVFVAMLVQRYFAR